MDQALDDPDHPTFIARMKSGYAHMGYTQFLPGYCLLFAEPQVLSLNDLDAHARVDFLLDMSLLGDAVLSVTKAAKINYGILGNSYPYLHAHLYPRYDWEPEERRKRNVWTYPEECWTSDEYKFDLAIHGEMKQRLVEALARLMQDTY